MMHDPDGRFDWHRHEAEFAETTEPVDGLDQADAPDPPVLVDRPRHPPKPGEHVQRIRAGERRPIVPAWVRDRNELTDATRWLASHVAHTSTYHAVRLPKYAGRVVLRAPRGGLRLVGGLARWASDAEGGPVRLAAVRREDAELYLKLSRQRDARVRWRTFVAIALTVGTVFCLGALLLAPGQVRWSVLVALVVVLGILGAPADRPLLDTAVVSPRAERLTSKLVIRALSVLGLAGVTQAMAKDPGAISFAAPITRDGPGWRADINLPHGVTAAEVIDRRDKLASGLGRPLGCVWPEANHEISPGRLILWVGDQDMATARQPSWPLVRAGSVDLFKPFPFGTDPRGRPVTLELAFTNLLIGSIPGYGKTFSLRVPLLAAALDPRVELWPFELKGTGDLEAVGSVSARYASGADDDTLELALLALRDLRAECAKRATVIKGLPKGVCPENKVTPELAARMGLGLHLLVVAIDECQELFTHPEFGKEAGELAERIIKLGRALGVILLLATQRPDARSLPTGVSANVGTRFCLRVMGQVENDMILGTSAYKNGVRASMFTRRDKGVGYLVGGDEPQITRTYYVDNPTAERIIARAKAARETAGTLVGYAAGEVIQAPARRLDTLLDDILTVVPVTEPKVWTETLLARLVKLHPEVYAELTREQLTAALRPYGITTGQVWGQAEDGRGANRRGIDRQHVTEAVTQRDRKRGAG
jgi:DNA segregation ATPase FtsK/SpoIIIE, S-DNA-T family